MSTLRDNPIVTILANEGKDIAGKRKLSEDLFQKVIKETQHQDVSSVVIKKVTAEVGHLKTLDHLNGFLLLEPFLEAMKISNPGFIYRLSLDGSITDKIQSFLRLCFCMPYTKSIVNGGYYMKVLGIDTAHLKDIVLSKKSPRTMIQKGCVGLLTTRLINNKQLILAVKFGYSENTEDFINILVAQDM